MERVARYTSMVLAEQAAMRLRAEGIEARVVGHMVRDFYISLDRRPYEVMVADKSEKRRAGEIIAEMHAQDPDLDRPAPIEEGAWRPNLEGLDADRYRVQCPSCKETLPMDASIEACPSCGTPVDVVDEIARVYGPEAFNDLPDDEAHDVDQHNGTPVVDWPVGCTSCGESLRGKPLTGRCQSCGSLYALEKR